MGAIETWPAISKANAWLSNAGGLMDRRWFLPAVLLVGARLPLGHVVAIRNAPWLQHLQLDHRIVVGPRPNPARER
jgi:hypothetical protein